MQRCKNLKWLLSQESPDLKIALDENKYYLSEKAHHDVGEEKAKMDFIKRHMPRFGREEREKYCPKCKYYSECEVNG